MLQALYSFVTDKGWLQDDWVTLQNKAFLITAVK